MNSDLFLLKECRFSISYDANDNQLSEHKMDADVLAKSITNVAQTIKHADEILNGKKRNIQTYVSAPAKEGSLSIELVAALIDPMLAEKILIALGFISPISSVAMGVIKALRKISGREVIEVHTSEQKDYAELYLSDGEVLTMPRDEALLVASPQIRKNIKNIIVTPLWNRTNPVFRIKNDNEEIKLQFDSADIKAIRQVKINSFPPRIDKITINAAFSQVNFDGNKGWKVQLDPINEVNVLICDKIFLDSVSKRSQGFLKEDIFRMVLEITTYTNDLGQKNKKYKILQVWPLK